jgi:hypothetical protein
MYQSYVLTNNLQQTLVAYPSQPKRNSQSEQRSLFLNPPTMDAYEESDSIVCIKALLGVSRKKKNCKQPIHIQKKQILVKQVADAEVDMNQLTKENSRDNI